MFRHVPECSGMFRVPGFIDGRENIRFSSLFALGDVSRETSSAAKSEEKRMFLQARHRVVQFLSDILLVI